MTDSPTFDVETALAATIAPRVTEDRIKAVIVGETFARLTGTLTVCVLTLANGFTVTGESACASPENYDQDIGEHYARKDAERRIWPLEGYLLRQQLHDATMPELENLDVTEQPGLKAIGANTRWRKKPVVIDAVQFTGFSDEHGSWQFSVMPVPAWLHEAFESDVIQPNLKAPHNPLDVHAIEGVMSLNKGDWIIRGLDGGLYPVRPDIFAATYEPAEQPSPYVGLPPHMQRVAIERDELADRLGKLTAFIAGETFATLVEEAQFDLVDQQSHMCAYLARLNLRLDRYPRLAS